MAELCPRCGSELEWIPQYNQYYCNSCRVYPRLSREEVGQLAAMTDTREWLLKGWAIGLAYYNIYFDAYGMHAVRLDLVGAGRVLFGGFLSNSYTRDKRIWMQNKVQGKSLSGLLAEGYKVGIEAPYDQIKSINVKGMLTKKLIVKTTAKTYKFIAAYGSGDPRETLREIPHLQGKLVFK